jgi:hypothetical protein
MNRGYLALGAAVVLAAVLGLYVALSKDQDTAAKRDPDGDKPGVTVTRTAPNEIHRPEMPAGSVSPASGTVSESSGGSGTSEYTIGGVRVRDHRSGEHAPLDIPPAIHPPGGRKIPSQLTSDIAQRLRGVVTECASSVPLDARGAAPRLEGEILIAIKDHQATITSATYQARDVTGQVQASIKQCMEQKSVGVATPSGDEPDVEGYAITLSLRLP